MYALLFTSKGHVLIIVLVLQVEELAEQLRTARGQLALKLSLVAEKDALIASLLQQTGQV